ncbi:NAD(P)/FAD-dependent oxidoreductase [Oricola sp.]|uniref:NAD(P)/FAD-dependent oxidoreductase n=1 Tax=Oricola sp. TaxID=1979950 RepID=UPI003BA92063
MRRDAVVLGAGIVGVATAIHLRKRGLSVALVDRRAPGEETSHGNAGLIQREGVHPYMFPRNAADILRAAFRRGTDADYHLSALPHVAPFLLRYFRASASEKARRTFLANIPLFERCLDAHATLMREAGSEHLVSRRGWIRVFRDERAIPDAERKVGELRDLGLTVDPLDDAGLRALEPHLDTAEINGAMHYHDPWNCSDPGALVKSYAALFETLGGELVTAEVRSVERREGGWHVETAEQGISADHVVVALGPWSRQMAERLGIRLPMGIKRGYHRHFAPAGNAYLTRHIVDDQCGYVLAPMVRGIRLTTGAEFARQHAPPTPRQLRRVLPLARQLFPLGDAVDDAPWIGCRPVFPDMLPVLGPAPSLPGLWLNFGHGHHGFTLGPATGELLAQMIAGDEPFCDPAPYAASRFIGGA